MTQPDLATYLENGGFSYHALRSAPSRAILEALRALNDEMATRLGLKILVDKYDLDEHNVRHEH